MKKRFERVLKQFGFAYDCNRGKDVDCYVTKDGKRYAEIFDRGGWWDMWIVGEGIRNTGTMSYPGGTWFDEPEKLKEYLQSIRLTHA